MRKALATFGTGPSGPTLDLALPTFRAYAERHRYDVAVGDGESDGRPPSWGKVLLFQRLLAQGYDFVLWVDADAIILDNSIDLADVVPVSAFQAYSVVDTGQGMSPCCGVWAVRAGERTERFLQLVWDQTDLIGDRLWEQSAVMRLTGRQLIPPFTKASSEWDDGTVELGEEWDALPIFRVGYSPCRIRHYGGMSNRRRVFEMTTDLAEMRGRRGRAALGRVVRRIRWS